MQINPPFDGSAPCPMCSQEIRGASAYVHNFLVRWPESKAFVKLNDLRRSSGISAETEAAVTHPAVRELIECIKLLRVACEGMTEERGTIRWTPEVTKAVGELVPRLEKSMYDTNPLSDAHFHDNRHAGGTENILRERQGAVGIRFLPSYSYHYTVEISDDPDLMHAVCHTGLKLHQHFKDDLIRDITFYAKVWCPTCRINAPFKQFARWKELA